MSIGTSDEDLGDALREMFAATDPVPPAALAAARAALAWRDIDAELAALTRDSLTAPPLASVRGTPPRLLTFATDAVTIDLEVTDETGLVRMLGQLSPAHPAEVTVEWDGGTRSVTADALGRFTVEDLPVVFLRVRVGAADGSPSRTEWFKP
jgi:hypothetical protein